MGKVKRGTNLWYTKCLCFHSGREQCLVSQWKQSSICSKSEKNHVKVCSLPSYTSGGSTPINSFFYFRSPNPIQTKKKREKISFVLSLQGRMPLSLATRIHKRWPQPQDNTWGIAIACKSRNTLNPQLTKMVKFCWDGCEGDLVDFRIVVLCISFPFPLPHYCAFSLIFPPYALCITRPLCFFI